MNALVPIFSIDFLNLSRSSAKREMFLERALFRPPLYRKLFLFRNSNSLGRHDLDESKILGLGLRHLETDVVYVGSRPLVFARSRLLDADRKPTHIKTLAKRGGSERQYVQRRWQTSEVFNNSRYTVCAVCWCRIKDINLGDEFLEMYMG